MDRVPIEVLECILCKDILTVQDVVSFASTSKFFKDVVTSSKAIWKYFFAQRWTVAMPDEPIDWCAEYKEAHCIAQNGRALLYAMSPKFYKRCELSDLDMEEFSVLFMQHPRAYHYLVADLMHIIHQNCAIDSCDTVPINTPGNKTLQYYAYKVLRFLRQKQLKIEWSKYMELPAKKQIMETGAIIVAQWCQSSREISIVEISKRLDGIASLVKEFLAKKNASHPLLSASHDDEQQWRENILKQNVWSAAQCRQILDAMTQVLYKELAFVSNNDMYCHPESSYVNEVLDQKGGLPLTLAIVYEAVARRLGVKCDPINFPSHFLLRWSSDAVGDLNFQSFYIDVFNGGELIKAGACSYACRGSTEKVLTHYQPASAKEVIERMANNLEFTSRQFAHPTGRITRLRNAFELLHMIDSSNSLYMINLARLYMLYNMDVSSLRQSLREQLVKETDEQARNPIRNIIHMLHNYEAHHKNIVEPIYPQAAARTAEILYAVGMVMEHSTLHYKCVIYDWDHECLASPEWQAQMGVRHLIFRDKQPFYNVLVDDGSHRYVAQENITPSSDVAVLEQNEDIGRHFSHYHKTYFVPNAEKELEYPKDRHVRIATYSR